MPERELLYSTTQKEDGRREGGREERDGQVLLLLFHGRRQEGRRRRSGRAKASPDIQSKLRIEYRVIRTVCYKILWPSV